MTTTGVRIIDFSNGLIPRLDLLAASLPTPPAVTFQPPITLGVGSNPYGLVAGDFNGDGRPDLVATNYYGYNVSALLSRAGGLVPSSCASPSCTVGADPIGIVAADFSRDGKLDVAVGNYGSGTVSVLLGNGDGTFYQPHAAYPCGPGGESEYIAVGDFDRDGKLDFAVANYGGSTVSVLKGNGDGTFQAQIPWLSGSNPVSVVTGDFRGVGKLDLAVTNRNSNTMSVMLGNGDGTFQTPVPYPTGGTPQGLAVADLNHDGKRVPNRRELQWPT
jgi:hypothetical protein